MIIVRISAGLGNQMFQYTVAKSLAIRNETKLLMDISCYDKQLSSETPRQWTLKIFPNIEHDIASPENINSILPQLSNQFLKRAYRFAVKKFGWINKNYIIEKSLFYSPIIISGSKVYLEGYWQSYKYFFKNEDLIKYLFDLSYLEKEITIKPFINKIRATISVSLHVRRGDYISNNLVNNFNGACNLRYYYKAIENIRTLENSQIQIFIFSDDIEWCKENLNINENHLFISTNSVSHDFYLMSICRHNIIANSTFSWWAAWLNNNPHKIVVAPKKWHKGFKENNDDLLPANWIQID